MFLKSLALIPVILAAASGSSSLAGGESLDSSSVMEDLSTCAGFKASDFPFDSAFAHAEAVGGDFRAITMSDGADSFRKEYVYFYHPSGLTGGYFDSKHDVYRAAGSYKIKLSVSTAYDVYERYDAKLLSVSSDGLFWKFSLSFDFGFDATFERGYDLAALEVMDPESSDTDGRDFNSYALGSRFTLSGSGSSLDLVHETFDVVSLDPVFYCFALPGINGRSVYQSFAGIPYKLDFCYSVVYSLMFSIPKSYGTIVGVDLSWSMVQIFSGGTSSGLTSSGVIGTEKKRLSFDKTKQSVLGWDSQRASECGFLFKLVTDFNKSGADTWEFPCVQKCSLQSSRGSFGIFTDESTFAGNPYLVSSDAKNACEALFDSPLTEDVYCVHFDVRDGASNVTVNSHLFYSIGLGAAALLTGDIIAFLGSVFEAIKTHFQGTVETDVIQWDASDLSVLSLLMEKDGRKYVLAVSADGGHIDGSKAGTAVKTTKSFWDTLFKVLLIGSGVVLACLFVYWFLGIFHVNFNVNGGHHGRKGNRSRRR